ncbi:Cas10/Cmr2 second palm domain-containing protein [Clostridium felsineum]|uniref:Cas10/Cmr2 second palm domain-containing protein n=1 Tax=Clostridium felsineum TaxID=36839 RepID=UPI001FA87946|nr:hypothetical protein [Clostridium felsineum]
MKESTYYVVKIDIGSKQKYIFRSNVLKEIIGASKIIKYVSEELGIDILKNMDLSYEEFNIKNFNKKNIGHKLFAAGGNSMYIFSDEDQAIEFNKRFSKYVIEKFDGLELLIVMKKFDLCHEKIINLYDEIENELTKKKGKRQNQFKRIGYGLTELCKSTRKPAIKVKRYESEEVYISKEANDKLKFYAAVYNDCKLDYYIINSDSDKKNFIKEHNLKDMSKFPDEIEDISWNKDKKGGYIGVTCIDGNGMGKKIQSFNGSFKYLDRNNYFEENMRYIEEFNKLTKDISNRYINAFEEMVNELKDNYKYYSEKIGGPEKETIPLRPIILAGDDITFISNGKLSIDITKNFIKKISNEEILFKGDGSKEKLTVGAGVAIVKEKHPFFRAVKIAEELEENSKRKLKKIKEKVEKYDASIIDWQIERGNIMGELSEIRKEKSIESNRDEILVGRPYIIDGTNINNIKMENQSTQEDIKKFIENIVNYNFDHFENILKMIWYRSGKSNIKGAFRAMNSSEEEFKLFALKYNLNKILNVNNKEKSNVYMNKQLIYDAVDVMDLYTYVKGEN